MAAAWQGHKESDNLATERWQQMRAHRPLKNS